jgi:hypothetical protein
MLLHIGLIVLIYNLFIIFPINHLIDNLCTLIIWGKYANCLSHPLCSDMRISHFITPWVVA